MKIIPSFKHVIAVTPLSVLTLVGGAFYLLATGCCVYLRQTVVCVCVCVRARVLSVYIYIYILYIYMCVCVCVCVCVFLFGGLGFKCILKNVFK